MTKQTKWILAGVAIIAVLLLGLKFAFGQDEQQQLPCMTNEDFSSSLEESGAYKTMFLHISEQGVEGQIEVVIKPDTKEWFLVGNDGVMSCLIMSGTGYVIITRED